MNIKTRLGTALIYPIGDGIAQLILQEFSIYRFLSLTFLAFAFYSWEIPGWFKLLDSKNYKLNWLGRTIGAILYFNPLWIARHMFFISLGKVNSLCAINLNELIISSLILGTKSFIINLPISVLGNFIVQVKLKLKHRFLGSVILTSLFAICYALIYRFL